MLRDLDYCDVVCLRESWVLAVVFCVIQDFLRYMLLIAHSFAGPVGKISVGVSFVLYF